MIAWKTETSFDEMHTILIISQDSEMVSVWETLFQQKNCHVIRESTPRHALQASHLLSPTLIVLDLDLPDHERLVLCKGLRSTTSGTLLLLAPKGNENEISRYHSAGVDEYLSTPISPMALLIKSMAWLVRQEWLMPRAQSTNIYA
jgi:DNA-binding response OmpR family regulator